MGDSGSAHLIERGKGRDSVTRKLFHQIYLSVLNSLRAVSPRERD